MYYGYGYGLNYKGIGAAPSTFLLDLYPAEVAYSLRQLKASNPNVIRIRRDNDNAEADFKGSDLLDGTAVAWVGVGNTGFVSKWYNQGTGGATYDAVQTTAGSQQRIINAGGAVDLKNGKPCITSMHTASRPPFNIGSNVTFKTFFIVQSNQSQNLINTLVNNEVSADQINAGGSAVVNMNFNCYDGTNSPYFTDSWNTNQNILYGSMRSNKIFMAINGNSETDKGTFDTSLSINELAGRAYLGTLYMNGQSQEWLFYNSDQSANRTAIRNDINTYYGTY